MSETNGTEADGPLSLRLAVLALWIEAVFLVALAIFQFIEVFTADPANPGVAVLLAAATGSAGVLAFYLGVLLTRRRSWPRGVAIVLQLMGVPVAFFMVAGEGGTAVMIAGVALGLYCLACAGLLLAPASRLALR